MSTQEINTQQRQTTRPAAAAAAAVVAALAAAVVILVVVVVFNCQKAKAKTYGTCQNLAAILVTVSQRR